MRKSPDAFRTISEVAQELDLPQHVLRFWETRFSQIKPMKRGGGRRYYRPDDVDLLRGIKHLLYGEGYTIKGVQRILKEQGARHVIDSVLPEGATEAVNDGLPAYDPAEPGQVEVKRPPLVMPGQAQAPVTPSTAAQQPVSQPAAMQPQATAPCEAPSAVNAQVDKSFSPPPAPQVAIQPLPQEQVPNMAQGLDSNDTAASALNTSIAQATQPPVHAQTIQESSQLAVNGGAASLHQPIAQPMVAQQALATAHEPVTPSPAPQIQSQTHPTLPHGLLDGEPKFMQGQQASVSVEEGRAAILSQGEKGGFFSRLKGGKPQQDHGSVGNDVVANGELTLNKDDIRRLQSTLFELLECKRLLDQARD